MNEFRLIGDLSHVVAVLVLTYKLFFTKSSAAGLSWKSQFLYGATYCARYSDLFLDFMGYYISGMKIFFILTTIGPVVTIPWILKAYYQKKFDAFWIELLILPVTALSLVLKHDNTTLEILWTWSIYMEAVAMIPQFYMTLLGGHIDGCLITYLAGMCMYRGFYIFNWIYRYYDEQYYDWIAIGGGITETVLGLCGLIMTIIIYRRLNSGRTYFQVNAPSSIYTLPSVTSLEKGSRNSKPMSMRSDRDMQSLLNILDEEQSTLGPYNHKLSVPIHNHGRSFVA